MNVGELKFMLSGYENKELPVTATGNNSFCVDITDTAIIENGNTLLLYENSYRAENGKVFLSPVKTIRGLMDTLGNISDKNIKIKARGTNGVLICPNDCGMCCADGYTALNLCDKTIKMTNDKAKKDAQIFIDSLCID